MDSSDKAQIVKIEDDDEIQQKLEEALKGEKKERYVRFVLAALGSVPWIGGLFGALSGLSADRGQTRVNELHGQWLEEHQKKLQLLGRTIYEIMSRVDALGEEAQQRLEGDEYLELVRQGFRVWDESSTQEKRNFMKNLLSNGAGTKLCSDDVVRMFIEWIEKYHEMHFAVIREIYRNPGISRAQIWDAIRGVRPRDDSAEADLFKLLIRDLSTGGIIRQHRPTNEFGQYMAKGRAVRKGRQTVLKTPFDDIEPYELTELGNQFVHYTMEDIAPRLSGDQTSQTSG